MGGQQFFGRGFKLVEFIFFSNYFYGFCAVALSIEAMLQQRYPLNGFLYFFIVFISTVLYYGYPYVRKHSSISDNPRTNWFSRHHTLMVTNQVTITVVLVVSLVLFAWNYWSELLNMPAKQWLLISIFPAAAAMYYGINLFNLRKIGWLKPFIIGFTWAGLVTIYPVLFYDIVHHLNYEVELIGVLLSLKNMMFVAVLCIMFDIKDYATDYTSQLQTFVVKAGLRSTIFYILIPLSVIGLITFIYYAVTHGFHYGKLALNIIPFILLMLAALSLRRRRSLLYYLTVIDGLLLVKALCGSIAMIFF